MEGGMEGKGAKAVIRESSQILRALLCPVDNYQAGGAEPKS